MKHTLAICLTVLLLAAGGGYLLQQEIDLQNNTARAAFAKDHAYYDLESSKFQFDVARYTVELKEYLADKAKSADEAHPTPTPPSPPADTNLRADNNP